MQSCSLRLYYSSHGRVNSCSQRRKEARGEHSHWNTHSWTWDREDACPPIIHARNHKVWIGTRKLAMHEWVPKSAGLFLFFGHDQMFQDFNFCVIKQENTNKKITQRHPWRTWPKKKSQLKYRRQRTHRCSHAENKVDINQLIYKNMHRRLKSQTYHSHSLRCNATTVPQVASNYKRRSWLFLP